jgi:haloacetate dehalogenase
MLNHLPLLRVERGGVHLHTRSVGSGTPLLLLHGHPQSMVMWHKVLPRLAEQHTLVLMDLRGYGDSSRPAADAQHLNHSKREMALDALAVMQAYGFQQFDVLAHDRGARVAHRLALDHAHAVRSLMLLDIAPTLAMYENTTEAFARAYWHWFALIQPAPMPESLIDNNPARYVRDVMGGRFAGLAPFSPGAMAEYERCALIPGTSTSVCEDYRASAGIDLEYDRIDMASGNRLVQPLRVLWGEQGAVGRCFDVLSLWRDRAVHLSGESLPCGHYLAEEQPEMVAAEALKFFKST